MSVNNIHNKIAVSALIILLILFQGVISAAYQLEDIHFYLAPSSPFTEKELADYTESQLGEMAAGRDVIGLLRLLIKGNGDQKRSLQKRNLEIRVKKWADKLLDDLANIESSWIYNCGIEKSDSICRSLEKKAAAYLLQAAKKDRIRRVWGAGTEGKLAALDPLGTIDFISACAQTAGLTADTIAIALVDADENGTEGIGFAQIGRPGKRGYLALTGAASRYPYEVDEKMIAAGEMPYTIYLKRAELEIYRGLGEQGRLALAAKLRQLLTGKTAGAENVINECEADVLMIKRLLQNKLIQCFLHIEDYANDYRDLEKILIFGKEPGFESVERSLDYKTDLTIMEMADQYCREKLGVRFEWVLQIAFCGNNSLRDLLKKEIKRLEKKTVKKEALADIYLLLRAVEVCARDDKFRRGLNKMLAASILAGPDLPVRSLAAATQTRKTRGQLGSFLIWLGSKTGLLPFFDKLFPRQHERYFEICCGSGEVYLHRRPPGAVLNDASRQLMNIYLVLRDEPEEVLRYLEEYLRGYMYTPAGRLTTEKQKKDYYYHVRALPWISGYNKPKDYERLKDGYFPIPRTRAQRAARMIFLNHACQKGIWRFNTNRDFNVPYGGRKELIIAKKVLGTKTLTFEEDLCQREMFLAVGKALQGVSLYALDYEKILVLVEAGDLVYIDPPYQPVTKSAFTAYSKGKFDLLEQWRLARVVRTLHQKGCFVVVSNYNDPAGVIRRLYQDLDLTVIPKESMISRMHAKNKKGKTGLLFPELAEEEPVEETGAKPLMVEELVIRNFRQRGEQSILLEFSQKDEDRLIPPGKLRDHIYPPVVESEPEPEPEKIDPGFLRRISV